MGAAKLSDLVKSLYLLCTLVIGNIHYYGGLHWQPHTSPADNGHGLSM